MSIGVAAGSGTVEAVFGSGGAFLWRLQHFLNCLPQLAFRIEHELGGRDDRLAFFQAA